MREQGTAVSLKDQFVACISTLRENLGLYRTLIGEFREHTGKAEALLMEEPIDVHSVKTKILTVASIIAVMHKMSGGNNNKRARMIATDALVDLNAFGMTNFQASFLDENRMRPIIANDFIDRADNPRKKTKRGEGGSTSVQT